MNKLRKKSTTKSGSKVPAKHSRNRTSIPRATRSKSKSSATRPPAKEKTLKADEFPPTLALYVYGVTEVPSKPFTVVSEAVDGIGMVEPMGEGNYLCWASRVSRQEFAHELQKNMENLEWLAACSIRHQKVLSEIGEVTQVLPARFGTVFLSPETLLADFKARIPKLRNVFQRISDADEWGVKIFGITQARPTSAISASSGSDYLRQKSAALQTASRNRDQDADEFGEELSKLSEATVAGGKASSGQPGLLWSASFLVKRSHKKRFDQVLKRYAERWSGTRRIDVSGPWPPYSFVSDGQ